LVHVAIQRRRLEAALAQQLGDGGRALAGARKDDDAICIFKANKRVSASTLLAPLASQ